MYCYKYVCVSVFDDVYCGCRCWKKTLCVCACQWIFENPYVDGGFKMYVNVNDKVMIEINQYDYELMS